jgi:hypothetical protein
MRRLLICHICETEFLLLPDHPGLATKCRECQDKGADTPRVMGKLAWSGKHSFELEITANREEAIWFNNAQKRLGAGVTRSLCEPKEPRESALNYGKKGSGAEAGASYVSRLGEKRTVKR